MNDNIDAGAITHAFGWQLDRGQRRANNQDSLGAAKVQLVSEDARRSIGLYMMADGVTSLSDGERASRVAIETAMQAMMRHINEQETPQQITAWLQQAAQTAHNAVQAEKEADDKSATTLVMAAVLAEQVFIVNIGDSRAYIIRNGAIRQITRDHTVLQELLDEGIVAPDEADRHPMRNVLSQAIGFDEIDSDSYTLSVEPDDYLLLCSDGLYGYVASHKIIEIVTQAATPQAASDALTAAANEAGGRDNIAVIVVAIQTRTTD